jgi:hypothetical protein
MLFLLLAALLLSQPTIEALSHMWDVLILVDR